MIKIKLHQRNSGNYLRNKDCCSYIGFYTHNVPAALSTGLLLVSFSLSLSALSTGTVEYTDCTSAEECDSPKQCPTYGTKQSDGEASIMLELWGRQITPSLLSLPVPLWSVVVWSDKVLCMCQIELNCIHTKLNCLKLTFIHLTTCKQKSVYLS